MDPVSHTIVGWSLTGTRLRPPLARGTGLAIILGALSPDIDLLLMPTGWDRYLVAHEAGAHSLIGAAITGALGAGVARMIRRRSQYRLLMIPAMVAALSHVAADLLSGASIRVGWPVFEGRVSNLGVFAMGDPYLITLLAVGALIMRLWRRHRSRCATGLVVTLAVLVAVKTVSRERAEGAYREQQIGQMSGGYLVEPVWGSLTWRFVDGSSQIVRSVSLDARRNTYVDVAVRRIPADDASRAAIEASRQWDTVGNFLRAHDFAFARVIDHPDRRGRTVTWSDIRYCDADVSSPLECAVSVGGCVDAAGRVQTFARVGDWLQYR